MAADGYVPIANNTMNSTGSSWLDALNGLGTTAGGIIGAIKGPTKPTTTKPTLTNTNTWTPILLIGGGVLLVIALVFALKK